MQIARWMSGSKWQYQSWKQVALLPGCVALVALMCMPAHAQSRTASVVGTVTDSSGGVVADAKVVVTNVETSESKTTSTNNFGEYTVLDLLYGRYEVSIEKQGFKHLSYPNLVLEIGQQRKVDGTLV